MKLISDIWKRLGWKYVAVVLVFAVASISLGVRDGKWDTMIFGLVLSGAVFAIGWTRGHARLGTVVTAQIQWKPSEAIDLKGSGNFPVEVVGESRYQDALQAICGKRKPGGEDKRVEATLVLEDSNKYDPYAVKVEIDGKTVGYLSRPLAVTYRDMLMKMGKPIVLGKCQARIVGGWERGSDRGHYGVVLDITLT